MQEKSDFVQEMAIMDPMFKDFLKLAVRKKPASQKLNKQTEKLMSSSHGVMSQSRIGHDLHSMLSSDLDHHKGFKNKFISVNTLHPEGDLLDAYSTENSVEKHENHFHND
jgi:predicted HD phosphohydrolase